MIEGKTEGAWVGISVMRGDGHGTDLSGTAAEGALEKATGKTEVKTTGVFATRGDWNWTVFSVAAAEEALDVEMRFMASVGVEELELAVVASLASVFDEELGETTGAEAELAAKIGGGGGVDADRAYTAPQTLGWYRWICESVTWLQWSSSISCHEFGPTGTRQA
jgi:hypothetical protein